MRIRMTAVPGVLADAAIFGRDRPILAQDAPGGRIPIPGEFPEYSAPRTADDKPDLNGIWQAVNTANWDLARLPTATDAVIITGTSASDASFVSISASTVADAFSIDLNSEKLFMDGGGSLTIHDSANFDANSIFDQTGGTGGSFGMPNL